VIFAKGGYAGGVSLYASKGDLFYEYSALLLKRDKIKVGKLPAGKVTIAFEMRTPLERAARLVPLPRRVGALQPPLELGEEARLAHPVRADDGHHQQPPDAADHAGLARKVARLRPLVCVKG